MARPSPTPPIVALEGRSGAGKSTVAAALGARLGWPVIAEAYDRIPPPKTLAFRTLCGLRAIEERLLEEDGRRYVEARALASGGTGVVLDTGFLGTLTYCSGIRASFGPAFDLVAHVRRRLGELFAAGLWGLPDLHVYLDVSEAVATRRAARAPASHPAALRRRHEAVGGEERTFFTRRLPRAFPGGVLVVPAEGAVGPLVERLAESLLRRRPRPPPTATVVSRVLASVEGAPRSARRSAIVKKASRPPRPPR